MDETELKQLISKPEWTDVEHKAAKNKYPKEALSSVSAFANTDGGYLLFGVDERLDDPIAGVEAIDKVQNEFIGILKDTKKFSCPINFDVDLVDVSGKQVLVFKIYEALRHDKPIYLNGDMKQTYLRKGGRDDKATDIEIKRIVRDSDLRSADERLIDLDAETFFDVNTVKWYRNIYERHHGERFSELYHLEFLDQLALVREQGDQLKPTLAAVLMFGNETTLSQLLPRFTLDAFWHHVKMDDVSDQRWDDRRSYECNLFNTWRQLSERFMYFAEQPFQIDETNLQRKNETPDYIGFREAAVNELVHQDYTDTQRIATIHFYRDASVYFNPGDSLIDIGQLGKGGSAARNPIIMQTFHRIKLSERAGSGLKDIYQNWQRLDRPKPQVINNKALKTFQITLDKKSKVTELQETIQQRIGALLTDIQARVFIHCLAQTMTVEQLASVTNAAVADIYPIIDHLTRQGMLQGMPDGYRALEHFSTGLKDLSLLSLKSNQETNLATGKMTNLEEKSDQPQQEVTNLTTNSDQAKQLVDGLKKPQIALIRVLERSMALADLIEVLDVSHRSHFSKNSLQPLMQQGIVAQTHPDTPNHQDQAYFLTDMGLAVKEQLIVEE